MTLYAIRPDPATGAIDEDAEVIAQSKYGWEFLEQAITLWRLIGDARADELEAIKARLERTPPDHKLRIEPPDLRELVRLLEGVDDAIVASGIVDQHWRAPPDQLEDLAKRVPAMDLKTERSLRAKTNALAEVMINPRSLRIFLEDALKAGCVVELD